MGISLQSSWRDIIPAFTPVCQIRLAHVILQSDIFCLPSFAHNGQMPNVVKGSLCYLQRNEIVH